jgi:hypothetical protein
MMHNIMTEPLFEGLKQSIYEAKERCQTLKDDWLHEDDPSQHAVEALLGIIDAIDGLTENINPNYWEDPGDFDLILRSQRLSVSMANVLREALKELAHELRYFFPRDLLDNRPLQAFVMEQLDELCQCSDRLIECVKDLDPEKWTFTY